MGSPGTEYLGMYITIVYTVVSMLVGAFVAAARRDFPSRGAAVSLFAGAFGPLVMALEGPSNSRKEEKEEEKKEIWPTRGPEAVILNIILVTALNYLL